MRLLSLFAIAAATTLAPAAPEYPKMGADLYDTQADGTAQIATALAQAKAAHKHVLVDLGANWCIWCRRLDRTFQTDAAVAKALQENYVLVLVDVNQRNGKKRNGAVNKRYGDPIKEGLPVLVVLDADGRQLTTQETGALEDGKSAHDPGKILAFLAKWTPRH